MPKHVESMEMTFPSDFKYLGAVDAAIQDLARELSCAQRWIDDFSTALIEACSNAIEHGNKYSKAKKVRVVVNLNGKQMIAQVHDQGGGFDYKHYLSDSKAPNPLSERGRGILIMKSFTDDLRYSSGPKGGICLELVKDCEHEDSTSSKDKE